MTLYNIKRFTTSGYEPSGRDWCLLPVFSKMKSRGFYVNINFLYFLERAPKNHKASPLQKVPVAITSNITNKEMLVNCRIDCWVPGSAKFHFLLRWTIAVEREISLVSVATLIIIERDVCGADDQPLSLLFG